MSEEPVNPEGNAAYWRHRAEQAEARIKEMEEAIAYIEAIPDEVRWALEDGMSVSADGVERIRIAVSSCLAAYRAIKGGQDEH